MKNFDQKEWLNHYEDFVNAEVSEVPEELNDVVNLKIKKLLNPNAIMVFLKILGIHVGVGFLSLSVCHQFGINPFNTEKSLAELMMRVGGHNFYMFGCGVLFVSLSLLAAGYFLTTEEVSALKRTELIQSLVLGMISLGLFAAFGAELAVGIAAIWLIGGLIGGFAATEAVWKLKQSL